MKRWMAILPLMALLVSCEVEFSPNAEWKEVPVVYCLLDQDDDTTWARVEKCFLGDGSVYDYGMVSDSLNYPEGYLQVSLIAYRDGEQVDSLAFTYIEMNRDSGSFARVNQPVYCCRTRNRLEADCQYRLVVRHAADGKLVARSEPVPLVKEGNSVITKPTNTTGFGFYDRNAAGASSAYCRIEWAAMTNARLYQPMIRFYYDVDGLTEYIDLKCPTVKGTNALSYGTYYSRETFLAEVKERLKDDPRQKHYAKRVDLYMLACSEELNAYMTSAAATAEGEGATEAYSNIEGGLGVVAARRMHLHKSLPADTSVRPNYGLYYFLKNLDINMD